MNLICKRWILLSEFTEPKPKGRISKPVTSKQERIYFNPNSISVSLRYSSGPRRLRSLRMMLSAPGPGGYTKNLCNHQTAGRGEIGKHTQVIRFGSRRWRWRWRWRLRPPSCRLPQRTTKIRWTCLRIRWFPVCESHEVLR